MHISIHSFIFLLICLYISCSFTFTTFVLFYLLSKFIQLFKGKVVSFSRIDMTLHTLTHLFIMTYLLHTYLKQFLHTFDSHLSKFQFISCTHTIFTTNSYLFYSLLLLFHLLHTPNPTPFHFFSHFTLFFLTKTLFSP